MDLDELLSLRNFFYVGAHARVEEEHAALGGLEGRAAALRDVYLYRDLLERGEGAKVLAQVGPSASAGLQAVRLLAQHQAAGSDEARGEAMATLSEWLTDEGISADPVFQLGAAQLFYEAGDVPQALRLIHNSDSLEHMALKVQCLLKLNRADLAEEALVAMKNLDDDDAITALAIAAVAAAQGGDKPKEALESLQELVDKFGDTVKLLNAQAACHMQLGGYTDAFQALRQARDLAKSSGRKTHADTLINTMACVCHMQRAAAVPKIRAELEQSHPNHPWLRQQEDLSAFFDKTAAHYAASQ